MNCIILKITNNERNWSNTSATIPLPSFPQPDVYEPSCQSIVHSPLFLALFLIYMFKINSLLLYIVIIYLPVLPIT